MQKDSRIRRSLSSYLRDMEDRGLTEDYAKASRRILAKFVAHCEDSRVTAISKVTAKELRGFMGRYQGMSASNQRYVYAVVKQFLKFTGHPLAFKFQWKIMGRPRQVRWLSPEQTEKLLTSDMTVREAFLVATGILAGARPIEIRRLTPRDLKDALSTGLVRFWAKGKLRRVPVHRDLIPVFEAVLKTTDKPDNAPILGISSSQCGHIVRHLGNRVSLELQGHIFRRTFATHVRNAGAKLETVSALLGHSSPSVTALYLDSNQADLRSAIDSLRVHTLSKPVN